MKPTIGTAPPRMRGTNVAVDREELRPDQVVRPAGVGGGELRRVAEALEDGPLGGGPVLARPDALLDSVLDR